MKTFPLLSAAAAAALTLALVPAYPARAGGWKFHAGSGCKVFGATAWTDLQFGATGIRNKTSTPKNIICPLAKDAETNWDGTSTAGAQVSLHLRTGNNTKTTTCHAYVVSDSGDVINTYSATLGGTPSALASGVLGNFDSLADPAVHATILCTLAAGARLITYQIYEWGITDN